LHKLGLLNAKLSEELHNVYNGGNTICALIAEALVKESTSSISKHNFEKEFMLTNREVEILVLVAKGKNNREIAEAIFVSENTVKAHLQSILRKLGVHSRIEAAIMARDKGIVIKQKD
jgi:DNA-binding NarL/FixJ family response regulator